MINNDRNSPNIPSQPFCVSSRNDSPHKRLLTFEPHSFPIVFDCLLKRPIMYQRSENDMSFRTKKWRHNNDKRETTINRDKQT